MLSIAFAGDIALLGSLTFDMSEDVWHSPRLLLKPRGVCFAHTPLRLPV